MNVASAASGLKCETLKRKTRLEKPNASCGARLLGVVLNDVAHENVGIEADHPFTVCA